MARSRRFTALAIAVTLLCVVALLACDSSVARADDVEQLEAIEWPRQYGDQGDTVIVFDPQIDSWEDHGKLAARSAVAVKPRGAAEPVYGVAEYTVDTVVDSEHKEVLFKYMDFLIGR